MQTLNENKRLTILISLLIITIIVAVPMIAFGSPSGLPGASNLPSAYFSSVSLGSPSPNGPAMTGSFGRYVGLSTSKLAANQGGYAGAKAACASFGAGAHVCTAKELTNSYEFGSAVPASSTELLWINNGPPGYILNNANDCNGWNAAAGAYGSVWLPDSSRKYAMITSCNKTHYFACCTY